MRQSKQTGTPACLAGKLKDKTGRSLCSVLPHADCEKIFWDVVVPNLKAELSSPLRGS